MKKIILLINLVIISAMLYFPVSSASFSVLIDNADLLSSSEEEKIIAQIYEIEEKYDFDVTILLEDIELYADSFLSYCDNYEELDPNRDGIVCGINMYEYDRTFANSTRNSAISMISDDVRVHIESKVTPYLTNGDYFKALNIYLDKIEDILTADANGKSYSIPFETSTILIGFIVIPLIVALIIASVIVKGVFIKQMKTAVIQTTATNFIKEGSFNLEVCSDDYTHETVTKIPRPKKTESSGSSGGSRGGYGGSRGGGHSGF